MVTWKQRTFAASIPIMSFISAYFFIAGIFIIPITIYFFTKRYSMHFVSNHSLRFLDLFITLIIVLFISGLVLSGIAMAARDGGFVIPFVSSGLIKEIIKIIVVYYFFAGALLHSLFSLLAREFSMPLSLRIFERIRGRKSANNSTEKLAEISVE